MYAFKVNGMKTRVFFCFEDTNIFRGMSNNNITNFLCTYTQQCSLLSIVNFNAAYGNFKLKKFQTMTLFCVFFQPTRSSSLMQPDLLKISPIILSSPLADCLEFRAYMAGICLCHQNINKYLNRPAKRLRKNNSKFLRRSGYFRTVMAPPHYNKLLILFPISLCWLKMVVCCKS